MAEDKIDGREATWRQLLPWMELFRGFQVAFDLNKLLLAAAGILVMAFGWWLLAVIFRNGPGLSDIPPNWPGSYQTQEDPRKGWEQFQHDRDKWNVMHETAGLGVEGKEIEVLDLANSPDEYEAAKSLDKTPVADIPAAVKELVEQRKLSADKGRLYIAKLHKTKPYARLATWPWWEDRGPNPYLLVTGQAGIPWEAGRFWDWFLRDQLLVMIEPLVKFVQPLVYFFSPRSGTYTSLYFLCVMLWTLATWAFFGGAITRSAAVQVTRGEKIGLREAVRFTLKRILSYLMAPLFPLAFVFVVLIFMVLFGIIHMIPVFGDVVWDGLLWWLMLICGLVMAVTLVGLVGWPLMSATISTEGTDSWEAVTRSYSYVYQRPWHFLWYSLVAIIYGAVLVFFIGFMSSLTMYLAKWGVSETPFSSKNYTNREPTFLFVYAPTSFGWRTLLLEGTTVEGRKLVDNGQIQPNVYDDYLGNAESKDSLRTYNKIGAFLVAIWLALFFLLMLGFGYSYFWSASTIIYLLMRRHVDAAELDEVYLEEDEQEGAYGGHFTPPAPSAIKQPASVTMVEAPTLRTPSTPPPSPPSPPVPLASTPSPAPVTSVPHTEPPRSVEPTPAPPSSPLPLPPPEEEGGVP